ncbi:hypothetical protein Glove_43g40 [Diversispora epigaea]|uniref:Uncharacterized protein n=1 Tax=Diversispora epigaea TaxID=1348612 RepID=A0A397JPM2_9GLOM|nr:hypothetical protein Glove_43g40 [Diversispora epigaea]
MLEYPNGEKLRNYLKTNFKKLDWVQQIANNFGISKLVIEPSINLLNSLGLIEYSDPMLLKGEGKFSRTKESDIYSGKREILIQETPRNYVKIYQGFITTATTTTITTTKTTTTTTTTTKQLQLLQLQHVKLIE